MTNHHQTAQAIADAFAQNDNVIAVTLGGSVATGTQTESSDIDLYVYSRNGPPDIEFRRDLITARSDRYELNNQFWETGDEWIERDSGIQADIMYRDCGWTEGELERIFVRHEAQVGYSTAIWFNLKTSVILFDREGWYAEIREQANQPYPEELVKAIVAKNYPILSDNLSSYRVQIKKAIDRGDLISVNHRIAAYIASYTDILFAVNRQPHHGEKRLMKQLFDLENVPKSIENDLDYLLKGSPDQIPEAIRKLTQNLFNLLMKLGLMAEK